MADAVDPHRPALLRPIDRAPARSRLGIGAALPFHGEDLWTGYEFSWLNDAGKPRVAGLSLSVACVSPNLVESKSMKLYLNSFALARFKNRKRVLRTLEADLAAAFGASVGIELIALEHLGEIDRLPGNSLDGVEVAIHDYELNPELLRSSPAATADETVLAAPPDGPTSAAGAPAAAALQGRSPQARKSHQPPAADATSTVGGLESAGASRSRRGNDSAAGSARSGFVTETWHTHLFRSLCPITGQPDWASVLVSYAGPRIAPEGLLRYLVSYRQHEAFHEDTIERIFMDIKQRCRPVELTVYGRFQRRGGLDINPYRSTGNQPAPRARLARQ